MNSLTAEHEQLKQTLAGQTAEVERQAAALQRAQTMQSGDDAMQKYFSSQVADIEKQYAKIEAAQEKAYVDDAILNGAW